ncbi:MAG: hypothetical protein ACOZE5_11960 [Verrucomicrobiota bacterium]
MTTPPSLPPLMGDQRKVDAEHLRLLAGFHFVLAGRSAIFVGFLLLHWLFLHTFLTHPDLVKEAKNGLPPAAIFGIFKWFCLFFGAAIVTSGLTNLAAGWGILRRMWRVFCLVVAGGNCWGFPCGTALGVFTLIVLLRESVAEACAVTANPSLPVVPPPPLRA